jgi:protein gp37
MAETSIEWTDATWNPVAGCTVLTAGCTNCYAMRMAARLEAMGTEKYRGLTRKSGGRAVWTGKIRLDEKSLDAPRAWSKPRKVFVNSMSDLFHDDVLVEFIARVWAVMKERSCPLAWCNWRWGTAFAGKGRAGQLAIAGRLTVGSSLNGAMVSSVM